jgi:hypothetical protein
MNEKVSIDFDSTLSRVEVQEFAKKLIDEGFEVWIVTSRYDTKTALSNGWTWTEQQNQKLFDVATNVGIPMNRIIFTNALDKITYLQGKEFILHLDDDEDELWGIIRSGDPCKPVNVNHFEWRETCEDILKIKK